MSRSLTTRAFALGLIALFHVAMFQDVVMLLCTPTAGGQVATMPTAGHDHHAMAHGVDQAASEAGSSDEAPVPQHDHGSCNFCCAHGKADVGRLPTLYASYDAPAPDAPPVELVELYLSPTVPHNTLPNPPPFA